MSDIRNILGQAYKLDSLSSKLQKFSVNQSQPLCKQVQSCARQISSTVDHKINELFKGIISNFDRTLLVASPTDITNTFESASNHSSSRPLNSKMGILNHSNTTPNLLTRKITSQKPEKPTRKREAVFSSLREPDQKQDIQNTLQVRKPLVYKMPDKKESHKSDKSRNCSLLGPEDFPVLEPILHEDSFSKSNKSLPSKKQLMFSSLPKQEKDVIVQEEQNEWNEAMDSEMDLMAEGAYEQWLFGFQNYRIADETVEFLKFQKLYNRNWDQIENKIAQLSKFAKRYEIAQGQVSGKKILKLLEIREPHKNSDFLSCFENSEQITNETRFTELKYLGKRGKEKAAVKIQAFVRMRIMMMKYIKMKKFMKKVRLIQEQWRVYLRHKETKKLIKQGNNALYERHQVRQAKFKQSWEKMQYQPRIQVHINSFSMEEIKRLTMEKFLQKQNAQISRAFRLKDPNLSIVYVCPFALPAEIVSYYRKVLNISQNDDVQTRLHFVWPDQTILQNASLCQSLLYSPRTLKRIESLIQNKPAYLVPGYPSNGYIKIADRLNIPIYGCQPNKALYLSTKIGSLKLCPDIYKLPCEADIYSQSDLYRTLTLLIYDYPKVARWFFKIDDEKDSRGLAYVDVKNMREVKNIIENKKTQTKDKMLIVDLFNALQARLKHKLKIVYHDLYKNYEEYMSTFLKRGGMVQASPNILEGSMGNVNFMVQIPPTGDPAILTSYEKIYWRHKPIAAEFPAQNQKVIEREALDATIRQLRNQGIYGFVSLSFLTYGNQFNYLGADCYLTSFTSSYFQAKTVTDNQSALEKPLKWLYCPLIAHPGLSELRIKTFFHLCRLANLSFDIKRAVGCIFTFVDSLQSGTLALMSICDNRFGLYKYIVNALEFFGSKLTAQQVDNLDDPRTDCIRFSEISNRFQILLKKHTKPQVNNKDTLSGLD